MINDKQMLFIETYLVNGLNGKKAYMNAYPGSKPKSAYVNASRLLKNDEIRAKIAELQEEVRLRADVKKNDLILDLVNIKEANICDYMNIITKKKIINKLDETTGLMIDEEIEYKDIEYTDTKKLTKEQQKLIKTLEIGKDGRIKMTLYEKDKAIDMLNKMLGYYDNAIQSTLVNTDLLDNIEDFEDLEKIIDRLEKEEIEKNKLEDKNL